MSYNSCKRGLPGVAGVRVARELTVVSAPPLNKAFERMRGTPTLLGWCPTRRRYVVRQQFSDTPAMIGDASSHGRCGLATGLGQTRVRCAEVRDRPDHIHKPRHDLLATSVHLNWPYSIGLGLTR